jgi:lipid-binding SYLF domain-containing protein
VGFQATGSSGSGVLIARLPNGSWSPPSGIQITSIGGGFVAGVDIYDCVIVINTREALDMFTKMRLSLGSDLAVTAGPFGAGGALGWGLPAGSDKKQAVDADGKTSPNPNAAPPLSSDNTHFQTGPVPENKQGMTEEGEEDGKGKRKASPFRDALLKPVYSYVKSRGFYAGVQIDGTVIAARDTANAKFYGRAVPVDKILRGEVPTAQTAQSAGLWPGGAKGLYEVLRGAEAGKPAQGQPAAQGQPGLWQGQGHAGRPGSGGYGGPSPAFGAAVGTGGAPPGTWVPPPGSGAQGGVAGVTAGVRGLDVGASSASGPPPGTAPTSGAAAKAAEAASEAARAPQDSAEPPPPSYSETPGATHGGNNDLPPAYVEDERYRNAGGDSKTGLH